MNEADSSFNADRACIESGWGSGDRMTRIMLCEDELLFAADLEQRLQGMGFLVTGVVKSGPSALELAETSRPDLALMDIHLEGGISGSDLAALLDFKLGVPSVYLTAYSDDNILRRAAATNALGLLVKPVNDRELESVLRFAAVKARALRNINAGSHIYDSELEKLFELVTAGQKKLRKKLWERTFGEVVSEVAHNVNNSLAVLLGNIEVLASDVRLSHSQLRHLASLRAACTKQSCFVKRLLWAAKEGYNSWAVSDLCEVVRQAVKCLEQSLPPGVRLRLQLPLEPLRIFSCKEAVREAILCVLQNAVEAIEGSGIVTVNVDCRYIDPGEGIIPNAVSGWYYLVSVSDTGVGIADTDVTQVLEPFFSGKSPDNSPGLGLAVTHGVSVSHGGGITILSELGIGTTVTIYIPTIENSRAQMDS